MGSAIPGSVRKRQVEKFLRLTRELGLGVVFCIPNRLTYSYFERMPVGYVEILMRGLKNGPHASTFRLIYIKIRKRIDVMTIET